MVESKVRELAQIGVDLIHPEGAPPFMRRRRWESRGVGARTRGRHTRRRAGVHSRAGASTLYVARRLRPAGYMPDSNDHARDEDTRSRAKDQQDDVDAQDAADLPEREAMSLLLDPGTLLGAGALPTSPTGTPTPTTPPTTADPSAVPTPGGTITVPQVPLPEANPGGTYNPDTSSTSST